MEILGNAITWLLDPAHWSGSDGIPIRLAEHVGLSVASLLVAALIAVPIGLYTGHTGRWGTAVTNVGDREVHTTITDMKVCRDENGTPGCPTGQVVHANQASGKTVTVDFDGSNQATVTTSKGLTFDKAMTCGG